MILWRQTVTVIYSEGHACREPPERVKEQPLRNESLSCGHDEFYKREFIPRCQAASVLFLG
jgi:hypothetical protein